MGTVLTIFYFLNKSKPAIKKNTIKNNYHVLLGGRMGEGIVFFLCL